MKKVFGLLSTALLTCSMAFAHVSNEYTVYDDMQFSDAKDEILQLRALGAVPAGEGVNIYSPQEVLTKEELGYWATQFLVDKGADAEVSDYVKEGLNLEIIDSNEGNATYEDVIIAYFGKDSAKDKDIAELIKEDKKKEITREETAILLGKLIERENGEGLFFKSGMQKGPNGKIEKVMKEEVTEGDNTYAVYKIVINGEEFEISGHPKALYGPTELEKWEGKEIAESWITIEEVGHGHTGGHASATLKDLPKVSLVHDDGTEHPHGEETTKITEEKEEKKETKIVVQFIQAKKGEFDTSEYAPKTKQVQSGDLKDDTEKEKDFPWVLTGGIVLAVILLVVVLRARKR